MNGIKSFQNFALIKLRIIITLCAQYIYPPPKQIWKLKFNQPYLSHIHYRVLHVHVYMYVYVFITTCPFGQVKYKFNLKNTCPNDIFTLAPKRKITIFLFKIAYIQFVHNTLLACPIRATVISWSFKICLPENDFYVPRAIGQVLINVAPCINLLNNITMKECHQKGCFILF